MGQRDELVDPQLFGPQGGYRFQRAWRAKGKAFQRVAQGLAPLSKRSLHHQRQVAVGHRGRLGQALEPNDG